MYFHWFRSQYAIHIYKLLVNNTYILTTRLRNILAEHILLNNSI